MRDRDQLRDEIAALFTQQKRVFVWLARKHLHARLRREAEDVVQDAFVAALEQIDRYRGESTLKTWISVIVFRTAWRRNENKEPTLSAYASLQQTPLFTSESVHQTIEDRQILEQVTAQLTPYQQQFLRRWLAGEFEGQMGNNHHRNSFARTKHKMKAVARKAGLVSEAA